MNLFWVVVLNYGTYSHFCFDLFQLQRISVPYVHVTLTLISKNIVSESVSIIFYILQTWWFVLLLLFTCDLPSNHFL